MTTYINQIVQKTRELSAVEAELFSTTGDARRPLEQRYQTLQDTRHGLVLDAIRAGIEVDLMQWAIGINDSPAKVQAQLALAHAAASLALDAR